MIRKQGHAVSMILIPAYILGIMASLSFLLSPLSGERIGLIITIQLSIIFLMAMKPFLSGPVLFTANKVVG